MTTPPGETCKLRYRWEGAPGDRPKDGDVLETGTGRRYLILKIKNASGSMRLEVLVMHENDELPTGARVHEFRWDKREKK